MKEKQDIVVKSAQDVALGWMVREVSEELPFKLKPEHHKGTHIREINGLGKGAEHFYAMN